MVPYCIPTAYFFTITVSFFIICIILVYRLVKNTVTLTYLTFIHQLPASNGRSPLLAAYPSRLGKVFRCSSPTGICRKTFSAPGTLKLQRSHPSDTSLRKSALSSKYAVIYLIKFVRTKKCAFPVFVLTKVVRLICKTDSKRKLPASFHTLHFLSF